MPISEDELDSYPYIQPHPGMSKAELRKSNKPIMEKRRRARINHSLNELKSLILEAMKKDPSRHSKLEKADILEMTVKHLQSVQRQQMSSAVSADPSVLAKFQTGFSECATEVSRYIGRLEGVDTGVKQRLLAHLSGCVSGLNQIAPLAGDVNNNPRGGLQLGRLVSGELALVLASAEVSSTSPGDEAESTLAALPREDSEHLRLTSTFVPREDCELPRPDPLDFSLKRPRPGTGGGGGGEILKPCPKIPRLAGRSTAFTVVPPRASTSTSASSEPSSSTSDMWRPW